MKKIKEEKNYLDMCPRHSFLIKWSEENGKVTLEIENTGFFNRLAQKFFNKPAVSYVHLDDLGSFIWPLIDGKKDIFTLGTYVKERFGNDAEPLYERLSKFFQILESYNFVTF